MKIHRKSNKFILYLNAALTIFCVLVISIPGTGILFKYLCLGLYFISFGSDFISQKIDIEIVRKKFFDIIFLFVILYNFRLTDIVIQLVLIRQIFYFTIVTILYLKDRHYLRRIVSNPALITLLTFITTSLLGAILLMLPISSATGKITPFVNAFFTSTSAVCVTGLIVVDTATYFSMFGKLIILILIQIGGIGIMTFSSAFLLFAGKQLNLEIRASSSDILGERNEINLFLLLKNIVKITFLFESSGALLLFLAYVNDKMAVSDAVFTSIFHSISAFCNAGFSVFSNNLFDAPGGIPAAMVVSVLIIIGGIGFPVLNILFNGYEPLRKRFKRLVTNEHSGLVLKTTAILIISGMIFFFFLEFDHSMNFQLIYERIFHSYFQSVTARTAGFNTIDMSKLAYPSIVIFILLMFIGASPGSTGGGIKTTTFSIMFLSVVSFLKGKENVQVVKKRVPTEIFIKAVSLTVVSLVIVTSGVITLSIIENFPLEKIAFEVVSAFGTVGLSLGITPYLSIFGKVLIIVLMFTGRVGPLTIILAMRKKEARDKIDFPEGNFIIG